MSGEERSCCCLLGTFCMCSIDTDPHDHKCLARALDTGHCETPCKQCGEFMPTQRPVAAGSGVSPNPKGADE